MPRSQELGRPLHFRPGEERVLPPAGQRLRRVFRPLGSRSRGGEFAELVVPFDERPELLRDGRVPCEKRILIDQLVAVESLQILAECRLNPWVFWLAGFRGVFQRPTPFAHLKDCGSQGLEHKHRLPDDEWSFPDFMRVS